VGASSTGRSRPSRCHSHESLPGRRAERRTLGGELARSERAGRASSTEHRAGIEAALTHGLSNARVESVNTTLRLLTRIDFGFRLPEAPVALAVLDLGGRCPPLPGRAAA
jgi:hypothetical protein